MNKLGWLILGLIVLWAHPSHAVPMSQCADGAHWYPDSVGSSICPPVITITTTSPGDTTITVVGTTTIATGTVTVSVRLACMELQWRQVTDGVGDEATGSDTDVTSGAFSVSITGVAEGTEYCLHVAQYTASGRPSNVVQAEVTTTESAPPPEDVGDEITGGDDWFFCPDGSDANSGLTHTLRKANYPTTDTSMLSTGDDMWLCTGGIWTNREMLIARAGDSGNIAETGTYYMDSTTPRKAVDGVFGEATTITKAELRGGLTAACLSANTCVYSGSFPVDTYSSAYDSLLQVASTADYNTVSNLLVKYTRYHPVTVYGAGGTGSLHHVIFDGIDIIDANGNMIVSSGLQNVVVRNGTGRNYSTCKMQRASGETTLAAECTWAGWSGGIPQIISSPNAMALVEYQHVTHGYGEGMNAFLGTTYAVFRNNFCGNVLSVCIYNDAAAQIVIENNIIQGKDATLGYITGSNPSFAGGIWADMEDTTLTLGTSPIGNVIRNNLCVNVNNCVLISLWDGAEAASKNVGAKVYGNTSVGGVTYDLNGGSYLASSARIAEWDARNNAIWNDTLTTNACYARTGTNQYNRWSHAQSNATCNGTGVTSGALTLTQNTYSTWTSKTATSAATFADANPAGGSALIGAGVALTSAILDKDNFGYGFSQIREVLDGSLTEAEWECALCVDALGATRANPPSKGAVE